MILLVVLFGMNVSKKEWRRLETIGNGKERNHILVDVIFTIICFFLSHYILSLSLSLSLTHSFKAGSYCSDDDPRWIGIKNKVNNCRRKEVRMYQEVSRKCSCLFYDDFQANKWISAMHWSLLPFHFLFLPNSYPKPHPILLVHLNTCPGLPIEIPREDGQLIKLFRKN